MDVETQFLQEKYRLKDKKELFEAFKVKVSRKEQLEWWVDREEELADWRSIIQESTEVDRNFLVFIVGSYGRGKSLSLLKIVDEADNYKGVYSIYHSFKGEESSKPGVDFILRIFKNIDFNEIQKNHDSAVIKAAIKNIPDSLEEPKKILLKIFSCESKRIDSWIDNKPSPPELNKDAIYFLRGENNPSASELKKMGIIRKIDSVDVSKEYLISILCFLKNLGYSTLVLAIDEFEYLFSLVQQSKQSMYIALLRSLYDLPSGTTYNHSIMANLAFFIAISEAGWSNLKEMEKREIPKGGPIVPLLERVDKITVLGVFDERETRELIEKRLRFNRTGNFESEPLIPFTEDFVDYIYIVTEGVPRYIVARCGEVLNAGISERQTQLTKEFAQLVLEKRGYKQL